MKMGEGRGRDGWTFCENFSPLPCLPFAKYYFRITGNLGKTLLKDVLRMVYFQL